MSLRLPSLSASPLPTDRDAMVRALADEWDEADGYVLADTQKGDVVLFLREGKVWCAGELQGERTAGLPIRNALARMRSATKVEMRETDLPLFLCLAVIVQKAPSAQLPANLIDSDQLLGSIKSTKKDAVLVIQRGDARSLAFCRGGVPAALYAAPGESFPEEGPVPDRIAEYLYGQVGGPEVTLLLYDDIRLPPAADALHLSELAGGEEPAALDDVPTIVVRLGGRTVYRCPLLRTETLVGRGDEANLALDNLSVSRRHLLLRREPSGVYAEDLGSENGILVDGERVERVRLEPDILVEVGKYTLELGEAGDDNITEPALPRSRAPGVTAEQTVAIERSGKKARVEADGKLVPIRGQMLSIGSGSRANLQLRGLLIADVHAVIRRGSDGFVAEHVKGLRKMRVNGAATRRAVLADGDEIGIAGHRLVFRVDSPFS